MSNSTSPRITKGALVIYESNLSLQPNMIMFQFNPEKLTRTLTPKTIGGDDDSSVYRITDVPEEKISLEVELDAADYLESPEQNQLIVKDGLHPQLAALETILYPTSAHIKETSVLVNAGTLEIQPPEGPYVVFVWGQKRVFPVRLTGFSVNEEAYDTNLNPIRAKVSLDLTVLSYSDFDSTHNGFNLFLQHHQQKERLAEDAKLEGFGSKRTSLWK